ncbi:MAG TPA: hypothetical protein VJQ85_12870 [Gaiellaceae bacterium]|nr:hypothetical protein [Gaiellaceae bacterium]
MLSSYGRFGTDAYDLVDRLPCGPARVAAWNAYVCQTYADKLAESCTHAPGDAAPFVRALYDLACAWLERGTSTSPGDRLELALPLWGTLTRSQEQLVGMRATLTALRTYVAFAVGEDDPRLAPVDGQMAEADALWIPRATPELRAGIGTALTMGIRAAAALGAAWARG